MMQPKGLMAPVHDEQAPNEETLEEEQGVTDGDEMGGETATPAEEQQVEALMAPVVDAIHGKGAATTLQKLKAGRKDLAGTIGEMAADLMMSIEQQIGKAGGKVEDSVKVEVGQEIVIDLVEIAAAAGLIEDTDDAKGALFKEAMMNAIGAYGDMAAQSGMIDRNQAKQQLGQMVQGNEDPIAKNIATLMQQGGGAQQQPGAPAPQGGEVQV